MLDKFELESFLNTFPQFEKVKVEYQQNITICYS